MKPAIGVTGRRSAASDLKVGGVGLGHQDVDLFFSDYVNALARAGAVPFPLSRAAEAVDLVAKLDGLVLAGGADINPDRYHEPADARLGAVDDGRDEFELALFAAALEKGIPVLGVCRGAQLINVALGGSLRQHVGLDEGSGHPNWMQPGDTIAHDVQCVPGSRICALIGERRGVNSLHHQTLERLGKGLVATATAPDGVIEAIELEGRDVLGVQWHPEMLHGTDPTFHWLVERARAVMGAV